MTMTENGGAICWPEQFPGEYKMAQKAWADADKKWPDRKRYCSCQDNSDWYPCRHCAVCGRFCSNIRLYGGEIGGMMAVLGDCKQHGEQCLDMSNWQWEHFEDNDE